MKKISREDELEDDQINIISQIYLDKGSTDNENSYKE